MEAYVLCENVTEGLRPEEATVMVKSTQGRSEYLRISRKNLLNRNNKKYLAIGVVHFDSATGQYLIEFPYEADSGTSRIWVLRDKILTEQRVPS
jgi:hypothetical protein